MMTKDAKTAAITYEPTGLLIFCSYKGANSGTGPKCEYKTNAQPHK